MMLAGFLTLGTIGFWIFFTAITILFWALLAFEKRGWATFGLIVALGLVWLFGGVNPIAYAVSSPGSFSLMVGLYIAGGVVCATYKWWDKCTHAANQYKALRTEWMGERNLVGNVLSAEQKEAFHRYDRKAFLLSSRPKVRENKALITSWMVHWPWYASWALLNDPITWIFRQIREHLTNLFDRISARAYRGIDED